MRLDLAQVTMAVALPLATATASFAQSVEGTPPATKVAAASESSAVAVIMKLEGDVLASTDSGLAAAVQGASLKQGMRVMTMARSSAVIQYADGCIVKLDANMRLEIRLGIPCQLRQDIAQMVTPPPPAAPPPTLPGMALSGDLGTLAQGAAAFATGVAIIRTPSGGSVSPN